MCAAPNPDTSIAENARRDPPHATPRWVKLFGIGAAIAVVGFTAFHIAGGGAGHIEHMAHGAPFAHVSSAVHGARAP
jgi:hypothetical protein